MSADSKNPLIVQSDKTLLLDVHAGQAEAARSAIMPFAELEKSPEHIHTYRITPLSLWNAASAGLSAAHIVNTLETWTRYPIPQGVARGFSDTMERYGKIRLIAADGAANGAIREGELLLVSDDAAIIAEIAASKNLSKYLAKTEEGFSLRLVDRGSVKWELIKLGWPLKDEAPLRDGEPLAVRLRGVTLSGAAFTARDYQKEAVRAALGDGAPGSGYGVVALPCGAGKTIVGIQLMAELNTNTLILTANTAAAHQWIAELLDKTELTQDQIAEYTGDSKRTAPVTVATYQILTWRADKNADFPHFTLFRARAWGLIIYDEAHLLPAPVFRITAELQAVRRLGLTATLVREDHEEDAVFSLVGPKRYDMPWKDLEAKGWIAEALCVEIRAKLPEELKIPYAVASTREKHRIASENPRKETIVQQLVELHAEERILVIGQYVQQLERLARLLNAPGVTGKMPNVERERVYDAFKRGAVKIIVVSKVANFAIDLPDASMLIQVSGSFGSRQEEAQRLGRILRPKKRNSLFYTLVSRYTVEEEFAANRQKFLAEQGYKYSIQQWE
ncbi:MAG: DEAD/DEAH box helicase [Treponema sp.]|jgi:DNA excision repair protein ERCC-3|nr:DEAD/DEAH box helicase [Treponema sp.]